MPRARLEEIEISYETSGKGNKIEMIMGLGGTKYAWNPNLINKLSEDYEVITYDNRGISESSRPNKLVYSIKDMAKDAKKLLDWLDIDRANVFGISMGGMIAQELALNYPEKVEKLALGCTYPGGINARIELEKFANVFYKKVLKGSSFQKILMELTLYSGSYIERNPDEIKRIVNEGSEGLTITNLSLSPFRQILGVLNYSNWNRLSKIECPTFVLSAEEDPLANWKVSKEMAKLIPNSKFKLYSGKHLFFNEFYEEVAEDLKEFFG